MNVIIPAIAGIVLLLVNTSVFTEFDVIWEVEYEVWLLSCVIDERYGLLEAILVVVIEGVTVATL